MRGVSVKDDIRVCGRCREPRDLTGFSGTPSGKKGRSAKRPHTTTEEQGVPVAADGPEISGSGRSDRNRVLVSAGRGGRPGAVSVGALSGQEGVGKGTEAGKEERGHPEASVGTDRRAQE